jgi:hypothetical protein
VRLDLKAPGGPAVGYGPPRTIYLTDIDASGKPPRTIYLTGIDASGKVAEVGWPCQLLRLTLERKKPIIRQLC